jgi:hypothetical protein
MPEPAAIAASLSFNPLSFPNKNNRCMSVNPFRSSDLRCFSASSGLSGSDGSKMSHANSRETRCSTAVLSESSSRLLK